MKFTAIIAAVSAATLVSAQGYNSTSHAQSSGHAPTQNISTPYDSRTVNVPAPSSTPPTAITSIGTIVSSCGTVQIYLPSTKVYPLSGSGALSRTSTFTGSSSATPSSNANKLGALAGMGAVVAGALML